jgi:hypothetical protein
MFECMDRSDLLNGFVPDALNGNGMEDMCETTTCTLDPKSEEVTTPHISSRKEQILEDLQNFSGNPKSIVVSGKIAYTQSEPNLSTMLTAQQQQETDPIGLLSKLDLFEPQVLNNKDSEDLTNFSNGQSVHATKSIPVLSSSVAVSTTLPKEQEEELLFGEKLTSSSQKAESAHGGNNSFPSSSSSSSSSRVFLSFFLSLLPMYCNVDLFFED